MKLEEIQTMWERDSQIDRTELGEESLRIPQLHSKYLKVFSQERLVLRKMEGDYKRLFRDKFEWYAGTISQELLNEYNWEPNPLKILRTDIPMHLEADAELNNADLRIEMQKEKVEVVEAIIKSLTTRGYNIKSAIEWEKFKMGV
jgi:hypothetical protein